ncbi:DeoR family transcriptional regulator [Kribbella sp. VKM Ac-2527]|uniref:DeoR family transcriptional regulator n=1 Tax=Kribbella caucasensis TaxID=2512215 RepID=A0A4R6KP15_9ACTN|nr:DeoR/GlpR family DNA-binding transcription regulator [Kribbella sp. VKM Ac-2527]TDO54395.1 DeoR family transcriptional regulator [Kribbella sp. VKM Ac-2527]
MTELDGDTTELSRPARRQAEIAAYVVKHGSVSANDLVEAFGVSVMTVHRDLDELERRGVVRKYRGGVTAQPTSVFESNVAYRLTTAQAEKMAIARHARTMIEPGMSVMLDDSTSALALVDLLEDITPLTVATNFLPAIAKLTGYRDVTLLALGGIYSATHDSFGGMPCAEAVEALNTDLLFCSVSAVSATHAFHQEQEIVLVKQAMLRAARTKVLLVDHVKLQRTALHRLAPLTDFDVVVVDEKTPAELIQAARDHGATVEVAKL